MASPPGTEPIDRAVSRLRTQGAAAGAASRIRGDADRATRALCEGVVREVAAFRDSANPDILPELQAHIGELLAVACRLLAGEPGDLSFAERHAERRAEQKFPLDAVLQAYRTVHRLLANLVRDAALAAADEHAQVPRVVAAAAEFAGEYTGLVGTLVTSTYVQQTRLLAETEGDRRTELLNILLYGYDESDRHAADLLRRAGYLRQRQSYCVAVARSVDPGEMQNPARAQRMADAITKELTAPPLRTIVGIRDNLVYAVVSGTRRISGWTAPQSLLADRVHPCLRRVGPAALIGLSNDAPSTAHIPRAAAEARLALDHADVATRVMPYAAISLRQMLVARVRNELQSTAPPWVDAFLSLDRRARGTLSGTLRSYADCDMNVLKAAQALAVHPNTVYARMRRIGEATGMNPLGFHALSDLLLAIDCRQRQTHG